MREDGAPIGASQYLVRALLPVRSASRRAIAAFSFRRRSALPATVTGVRSLPVSAPYGAAPSSLGQAVRPAISQLLAGVIVPPA